MLQHNIAYVIVLVDVTLHEAQDFTKGHIFLEALFEVDLAFIFIFSEDWPIFHEDSFFIFYTFNKMDSLEIVDTGTDINSV